MATMARFTNALFIDKIELQHMLRCTHCDYVDGEVKYLEAVLYYCDISSLVIFVNCQKKIILLKPGLNSRSTFINIENNVFIYTI